MSTQRNLVIVRAGDESLHPTWLFGDAIRTWDLHLSYFGSEEHPPGTDQPNVTVTRDDARFKWGGVHQCLEKLGSRLDDYQYVALVDDDVIVQGAGWNRAFEIMREYDLSAAQLGLHPDSFYTIQMTLRRPGARLRYTSYIECMTPLMRVDLLKKIKHHFTETDTSWAMDSVISHILSDNPRAMGIIDAVPALHTREHGVSPMYKDMTAAAGGLDYYQQEAAFLRRHGLTRAPRVLFAAIDLDGRPIRNLALLRKPMFLARARRDLRRALGVTRLVSIKDRPAKIARKVQMLRPS